MHIYDAVNFWLSGIIKPGKLKISVIKTRFNKISVKTGKMSYSYILYIYIYIFGNVKLVFTHIQINYKPKQFTGENTIIDKNHENYFYIKILVLQLIGPNYNNTVC